MAKHEVKQDLSGLQFYKWKVLYLDEEGIEKDPYHHIRYICECDCDNHTQKSVLAYNLKKGISKSCGCWNKERDRSYSHGKQVEMTGLIFNGLKVIEQDLSHESGAGKPKWWIVECPYCHKHFSIDGRRLRQGITKSCGCIKSFGENKINQILLENNIIFKTQYIFKDLPNRKFDFAIFDNNDNLQFLIEYDGEQHFNSRSRFYTKEGIERDQEKNLFCLKNNIILYRIPFWEYDNIINLDFLTQEKFKIREEEK